MLIALLVLAAVLGFVVLEDVYAFLRRRPSLTGDAYRRFRVWRMLRRLGLDPRARYHLAVRIVERGN